MEDYKEKYEELVFLLDEEVFRVWTAAQIISVVREGTLHGLDDGQMLGWCDVVEITLGHCLKELNGVFKRFGEEIESINLRPVKILK